MATVTWTRGEVERVLFELLRSAGIDERDLVPQNRLASLCADCFSDSLNTVEFVMAFEEAFEFDFDDDAVPAFCETVVDLIDHLCMRLSAR